MKLSITTKAHRHESAKYSMTGTSYCSGSQGPALPEKFNQPMEYFCVFPTSEGTFPEQPSSECYEGILSTIALIPYHKRQKEKSANEGLV